MHPISVPITNREGVTSRCFDITELLFNQEIQDYFLNDKPEVEVEPKILFSRPELLLHPNIPKPLHGLAPRVLMGTKWWNQKRREAYARNNYHCYSCGVFADFDTKGLKFKELKLHAHECYDINYNACSMELVEIVALCEQCHNYIHSGRMSALYDKGILDEQDCWTIRTNGERVLGNLKKEFDTDPPDAYNNKWEKWFLLLDGKKFFSKFKSYEKWEEHYA